MKQFISIFTLLGKHEIQQSGNRAAVFMYNLVGDDSHLN
jgi:hypothetical protein